MRTFAVLCVLSLSSVVAAAEVTVKNLRIAVSEYGPRKEAATVYAGEKVHLLFDAAGIKRDGQRVSFRISYDVLTAEGKSLGSSPGEARNSNDIFPAETLRCYFALQLPDDLPAGPYKAIVGIHDLLGMSSANAEFAFEVIPSTLAILNPRLAFDDDGQMEHGPLVAEGETLHLVFRVIGLKIDAGQAKVQEDLFILDESGKQVGSIANFIDTAVKMPGPTLLVPNQMNFSTPGKYRIKAVVRDVLAGKETSVEMPVEVRRTN